jgi:hypothetical protein
MATKSLGRWRLAKKERGETQKSKRAVITTFLGVSRSLLLHREVETWDELLRKVLY